MTRWKRILSMDWYHVVSYVQAALRSSGCRASILHPMYTHNIQNSRVELSCPRSTWSHIISLELESSPSSVLLTSPLSLPCPHLKQPRPLHESANYPPHPQFDSAQSEQAMHMTHSSHAIAQAPAPASPTTPTRVETQDDAPQASYPAPTWARTFVPHASAFFRGLCLRMHP